VPLPTGAQGGVFHVAAVQGDVPDDVPDGGVDALGRPFQVTLNHVAGTETLASEVRAGRIPAPDLVLWPENSSDVDPLADDRAAVMIDRAVAAVGVPILVGAVLDGPGDDHVRNAGLIWDDGGWTGQIYVKQHPVPFGEYLPGRPVLERLVGRFADEMPRDFLGGDKPGVIDVAGTTIGDVICFEVAYDGTVRDTVTGGARMLVVQTNNASFGRRGESEQQLAMTRLRAVEHDRATVQVSTTGQSAIIAPDGRVLEQSGLYEPALLAAELPLRTSRTVANRVGIWPEAVLVVIGLLAMIAGGRSARRGQLLTRSGSARSSRQTGVGDEDATEVQERSRVDGKRVVVCVPTYNERENLGETARRLRGANPDVHLLVIDDASPDGTGKIADELADDDPYIHVLHRTGKTGLGSAYVAGFGWALAEGFDVVVEMDADGSHQPEELPRLLAALDDADLVLGSRWVPGGEVRNWPRGRLLLSRGGNAYVRAVLWMPLRDATGGFRAYRADVLRDRDLTEVTSQGYCFQVDLAWRAWRAGWRVVEVPITFVERERGASKMSRTIVVEALWRVTWWGVSTLRRRPRVRPAFSSVPAPRVGASTAGAAEAVIAVAFEQRRPDTLVTPGTGTAMVTPGTTVTPTVTPTVTTPAATAGDRASGDRASGNGAALVTGKATSETAVIGTDGDSEQAKVLSAADSATGDAPGC
jgi:apolipoprotein N-acyltransferase